MSLIAKDLPTLIFLLLPGFIAAGVFYTLTAHPKTSEFERIVQSLIFTTLVRVNLHIIKPILFRASAWRSFGRWTDDVEFDWSVGIAIIIGLVFAVFSNKDWFRKAFRKIGFGSRTSHPSEWYAAFSEFKDCYILLHLDGDRRLRGWPDQWPDQPDKGYFILAEAEWVIDDLVAPLHQVKRIVVPATEVKMVEFLFRPDEIATPIDEMERVTRLLLDVQSPSKGESHGSQSVEPAAQRAALEPDPSSRTERGESASCYW